MRIDSLKFKGAGCFTKEWVGFDFRSSVTVIIGRNNTGKSQLLDLVRFATEPFKKNHGWEYQCTGLLDEQSLRRQFPANTSGGNLYGDHWANNGVKFIGMAVGWEINKVGEAHDLVLLASGEDDAAVKQPLRNRLTAVAAEATTPFQGRTFRHLLADRDIRTETADKSLALTPDGSGATNLIRRLISSATMPRELVHDVLRNALNEVFGQDGEFLEIQIQEHDDISNERPYWEIFLSEANKGLIPLSKSGSGLKTVILVLLNLLVIPKIEGKEPSSYVFAFEELENNLHPALLRRLLRYVETFVVSHNTNVFLTTHSSAALDLFGGSPHAQIVHVTHDGSSASAKTVDAHFDHLGVVSELGAKPSDLLQANGIVWVEGPSDAIYLNKWIDMASNGKFREGRDYLCAFYGGALLARTQFVSPEEAETELVNLLLVNPNVVVVCDSDKTSKAKPLKPRVTRIQAEIGVVPGALIWVTGAKEIENYLTGSLIGDALGLGALSDPGQYERFFPAEAKTGDSYVERTLNRVGIDKMDLAILSCAKMTIDDMAPRFDWLSRIKSVVDAIHRWKA